MAANITVRCPECAFTSNVRFDPGIEDEHPALAERELREEHPDHDNSRPWRFPAMERAGDV